jgi:hypothetical protein
VAVHPDREHRTSASPTPTPPHLLASSRLGRTDGPKRIDTLVAGNHNVSLSLVANGFALRVTVGDPLPDLDVLAELVERGVSAEPRKRTAPRRSVRATPRRS